MKTPKKYRQMEHRGVLIELVKVLEPEVYVELGVKKCYTFNAIAPLVKKAVAVDVNPAPCVNLPHVEQYTMTTASFAVSWNGEIDFLFIDADHRAESVIDDVTRMVRYLKPYKSIVCLHDTYPINKELLSYGYCSTAWRAAKHIRENLRQFEIVTLPGPWAGLSIMRYAPPTKFSGRDFMSHGWMDI